MKWNESGLTIVKREPLDENAKKEARMHRDLRDKRRSIHVSYLKAEMMFTLLPRIWRRLHRDHRFFEIASLYFNWLNNLDDGREMEIKAEKIAIVRVLWLDEREEPDIRCAHTVIFEFRYAGVLLEGITVWDTVLMEKIEFSIKRSRE